MRNKQNSQKGLTFSFNCEIFGNKIIGRYFYAKVSGRPAFRDYYFKIFYNRVKRSCKVWIFKLP